MRSVGGMELRHAIRTTGAVRDFTERPVDDSVVAEILDDARFAPSGGNRQPWKVAVVHDLTTRRLIGELMQPTWDEYVTATQAGVVPFNAIDYTSPVEVGSFPNAIVDQIEAIPVVIVVAADQRQIVALDRGLDRPAIVAGASIYPFCWNILLSARAHGLGGVLTTFRAADETEAAQQLGLPEYHAIAAVIFLGHPVHQPTRLRRGGVREFATVDRFDGYPLV